MLTEEQSKLFSEVLNANWAYKQALLIPDNVTVVFHAAGVLNEKTAAFRKAMGDEAYEIFMERGRKMFQPKNR